MPCLSAEELAAVYDGVLPAALARRARWHLVRCQKCSYEISVLSGLMARPAPDRAPPPAQRARALALLDPGARSHRPDRRPHPEDARPRPGSPPDK